MREERVNQLYSIYKGKVYKLALYYIKDKNIAEDLTQEVLIKCYLKRKNYNQTSSLDSWVYSITKNHCIDYLRKKHRQQEVLSNELDLFEYKKITPEEEMLLKLDKEELMNHINQLPYKYKEVIKLYYFSYFSIKEIHQLLNLKESTVKTRLSRSKIWLVNSYRENT